MRIRLLLIPIALLVAADARWPERERLVSESIEARGIRNGAVLRAMRDTPRHEVDGAMHGKEQSTWRTHGSSNERIVQPQETGTVFCTRQMRLQAT